MRETTLLFIWFAILVATYAANTSHLVFLASKHFKKNGKDPSLKSKRARIENGMNAVALIHTGHRREFGKAGHSDFIASRMVRLKGSSRDEFINDLGNTLMRYRKRRGKKLPRKVRFFRYGTITLASKQPATLYRNGKRLLSIRNARGGYKFTRQKKIYYGDVLSVESKRTTSRYGVAVDVRLKVKQGKGRRVTYVHYNTQYEAGSRMWRGDGILRKKWMTKKKQYCRLPRPTRVRHDQVPITKKKIAPPLNPTTRYVWVSGRKTPQGRKATGRAVVPTTAYLLLEVGMRCSHGHQYARARPRIRKLPPRPRRPRRRHRRSPRRSPRRRREGREGRDGNNRARRIRQLNRKRRTRQQPRRAEARDSRRSTEAHRAPRKSTSRKKLDSTKPPKRGTEKREAPQSRATPRKRTESRKSQRQNSPKQLKPRPSSPRMSYDESKPETVEKEDSYPPQCKCRASPQAKRSVCYRMLTRGKPYGRCRKGRCGVSYQCIPAGDRGLQDCIRRVATYEVVLKDKFKGVLRCRYKKLTKPKVYYALY